MRKLLDDAIAAEAGTENDKFCGTVFLGMIGDGKQQTSHPQKRNSHFDPPEIVGFLVCFPFSKGLFSGSRCKKMGLTLSKRNILFL